MKKMEREDYNYIMRPSANNYVGNLIDFCMDKCENMSCDLAMETACAYDVYHGKIGGYDENGEWFEYEEEDRTDKPGDWDIFDKQADIFLEYFKNNCVQHEG